MSPYIQYPLIFALLLLAELIYFHIADYCNIIDRPNERSSHSTVVLRGGGIIFVIGLLVWFALSGFRYPLFVAAVVLAAGISFWDDVDSLPDSIRLLVQIAAVALMVYQLFVVGRTEEGLFWGANLPVLAVLAVVAIVVCVGAANVYNFMDGINGITAGYSLAVLVPLFLVNVKTRFVEPSLLIVTALSLLVFAFFNCRPRGRARCFAGDVGSVGIALILLFIIGRLVLRTQDVSWLVLLLVYGVDGCLTICHRIMLHENLGQAHRKHAYQLMANELHIPHPLVTVIYAILQLAVSAGFIYLCPLLARFSAGCPFFRGLSLVSWHWIYLAAALLILSLAYMLFMKKYYHLHEEYLESINK